MVKITDGDFSYSYDIKWYAMETESRERKGLAETVKRIMERSQQYFPKKLFVEESKEYGEVDEISIFASPKNWLKSSHKIFLTKFEFYRSENGKEKIILCHYDSLIRLVVREEMESCGKKFGMAEIKMVDYCWQ